VEFGDGCGGGGDSEGGGVSCYIKNGAGGSDPEGGGRGGFEEAMDQLHRCPKQTSLLFAIGVKPRQVAHSIFTTQRSTDTDLFTHTHSEVASSMHNHRT
jgi:hypothetical protein